jgi:hypothetical protein
VAAGCAAHPGALPTATRPDAAGIETSLLLIGDAGEPRSEDPVLATLREEIRRSAASTAVVFLGDNIYPSGMPDLASSERRSAERRLDAQLSAADGAGAVYFIPGNHDWAWQDGGGRAAIRR